MSPFVVIITLAAALSVLLITLLVIWLGKRRLIKRLDSLNDELISVSADASVGRRLQLADEDDLGELATTINRLFDARIYKSYFSQKCLRIETRPRPRAAKSPTLHQQFLATSDTRQRPGAGR